MFDINKYIQENRLLDCPTRHVKQVVCKDGLVMSVQAGPALYSSPQDWVDEYTHVEIGYPSMVIHSLMRYCEDRMNPRETVYSHVPVDIVNKIVEDHGGLA